MWRLLKAFFLLTLLLGQVFFGGDAARQAQDAAPTQTAAAGSEESSAPKGDIVTGYYASWAAYSGYTPNAIPSEKLTHLHYAFARIGDDLKITLGDAYIDPVNFEALAALKAANPALKILISVGGWNDSEHFSDAALTAQRRAVFADSVVAFLRQYGFDGVDLDWEYPVSGGAAGNAVRTADRENFTLLLTALREQLDAAALSDGRDYLLTIAGGAGSSHAANLQLSLIGSLVDYAVLMTYDLHGAWDTYTDLNAPLYPPSERSPQYQWSAEQAVDAWTGGGFPADKLLLGVPFYGHLYEGVAGGGDGLYQTFSAGTSVPYDEIVSDYLADQGFTRYVHGDARVPWLFHGSIFLSYDDASSLREKSAYAEARGLAGVAVWELSQNADGTLLDALLTGLNPQ